jgi:hypothetical protein
MKAKKETAIILILSEEEAKCLIQTIQDNPNDEDSDEQEFRQQVYDTLKSTIDNE